MSLSILQEAVAGRALIQPWTVEQYHAAIANGMIEESSAFELLDGFIVRKDRSKAGEDPMTVGDRHALVVQRLVRLAPMFDALGCHLRIQQPIALPPNNEPEPDASVATGHEDDYKERTPVAGDVSCVIEVADSSLPRDLGAKLKIYAAGSVGQYVVVNLLNDVVLDYHQPRGDEYLSIASLRTGQSIEINTPSGKSVTIPVARLLS